MANPERRTPRRKAEQSTTVKGSLVLKNRQRARRVDLRFFELILQELLTDLLRRQTFDLGVNLVGASEMTRLNKTFLKHQGSTDVITFDYHEPNYPALLYGELFLCVDEALTQAQRFRVTWQRELVRYAVHGLLHLSGYDDRTSRDRHRMKREENRLVGQLARRFRLESLGTIQRS